MSDPSRPKQASIPEWQQGGSSEALEDSITDSPPSEAAQPTGPPPSRAALLGQASQFLKDDGIKDATTDKKVAFLETKGLKQEEIHRLLDLPSDTNTQKGRQEAGTGTGEAATASSPPLPDVESPPFTRPPPESSPPKDTPPIITYPEFLLHSRKPPPLINASNLITTLYAFSGAAAAIYGTSKYLIDPMLESLTAARHSLHETAQSNLDTLNERLEKHVSAVPEGGAKQLIGDDNASETTEDMGPLFHRTIGTQTSLPASPSSASSSTDAPEPPLDIITTHESSLKALTASLSSLIPPRTDPQSAPEEKLRSQVYELRHYLNALAHKDVQHVEAKDDAVNKFKAEIRGVKGVLLSARNFPSGTGRVAG